MFHNPYYHMSLHKRLHSFRYAFKGLADMIATQPNARIHLLARRAQLFFPNWMYFVTRASFTRWSAHAAK